MVQLDTYHTVHVQDSLEVLDTADGTARYIPPTEQVKDSLEVQDTREGTAEYFTCIGTGFPGEVRDTADGTAGYSPPPLPPYTDRYEIQRNRGWNS